MNESIQIKQTYLRENVLEKAYDADEFMLFLQLKKGENGLDLNNWTMNELIKAVSEFVHEKDKENDPEEETKTNLNKIEELFEEENEISTIGNEKINQTNLNQINDNNMIANKGENIQQNQDYLDMEKCEKSESTFLSNIDSIKVKLSSPQKIDGGIFSKSFVSYVVSTEPVLYKTNKRYSDFSWLRKTLSMIYPNCVLPPLCKKNFGDRFNDILIDKRMRSIEKFMMGITDHPLIRNSELLKIFLSEKKDEYKKHIKKYQKIKKPPSIVKKIKTINGYINIGINEEKEIYSDNIKNYAQGNYYILGKITKSYKSLLNSMQHASNKMKNISILFKQLLDRSIKYFDSHNTSETFNIMSQFMNDWGRIQENQIKIINENIREYFRYVKNEFNSLKEMANKVKNCKANYTKAYEKLLTTKENLFQKQEIDLWQLRQEDKPNKLALLKNKNLAFEKMLPQDTMKVMDLKNFYGCMLNSLISEFERIRKINATRHKENITNFIKYLSKECTNMHICLADRQSEFNQLKDDTDINNIDGGIQLKKVRNLPDNFNDENDNINNINNDNNINNNDEFDFVNIDYIDEEGNAKRNKNKKDIEENIKEKEENEKVNIQNIEKKVEAKNDEIKEPFSKKDRNKKDEKKKIEDNWENKKEEKIEKDKKQEEENENEDNEKEENIKNNKNENSIKKEKNNKK